MHICKKITTFAPNLEYFTPYYNNHCFILLKMKRILILLCIFLHATITTYAIDKQVLADTLTLIARSHAYVGNVTVNRVRVKNTQIFVYTNASLSHISLTPSQIRDIRLLISQLVLGNNQGKVTIYSGDMELGELVTTIHRDRASKDKYTLPATPAWVSNLSSAHETSKGLGGKHIALWGSHGRYYNQQQQTWLWQRAKLWTTVEDLYTSSYTMPFLVPMLENAGAVVIQPRERDTQTKEVIIDNPNAAGWIKVDSAGWGTDTDGVLLEGENPFEKGGYLLEQAVKGNKQTLHYTPHLDAGEYAVYVSYKTLPNSTSRAQYTVVHKGQSTTFSVNQKMGGGTWVYLGTFAFDADTTRNYVALSTIANGKEVVTADAVKFGGGMGNVARYPQPDAVENTPSSKTIELRQTEIDSTELLANQQLATTSGMARYLEASRYWLQYAGIPDSVYNYTASRNDYTDDYCSRGMWVNYLAGGSAANPKQEGLGIPVHLSLSFHSDAGVKRGDTIIGSLMIYTDYDNDKSKTYPTGVSRQVARDYGDYMQSQIVNDVRALYAPQWQRRQLQNSSYAEARYPKVPAVLLELLSHQNYNDMQFGLDPRVRFVISRAIYKGMLRFIHEQYGTPYVVQPLPVQKMAMKRLANEEIRVSWEATDDSLEPTAKPTYYIVYTRTNDSDWDNGIRIKTNTYTFCATPGTRYDIRVQAGNDGGVSMPSEVVSAYIAPEEKGRILVLNAFTRVSGPEWFSDSIYAGIRPQSPGVGYGKDISYIGEQFDFDTRHPWITDDECGWGSCYCDQQAALTMGNTFDYPVMHGKALAQLGYSYISANAYAIDTIADVDAVDLIMGKQKTTILGTDTAFKSFTPALQSVITDYLATSGRLLVSGTHIASDMLSADEKAFAKEQLHYTYRCDHASKQGGIVVNTRALEGGQYHFFTTPNPSYIASENPDCIHPADNAVCVARYADTNLSAAIAYDGTDEQKGKTLAWGFMLESTENFDTLYKDCINWIMK